MLATTLRARQAARLLLRALEDRTVPAVFAVTNVADSGEGSFRDALSRVVDGREDRIVFDESLAGQTVEIARFQGFSIRAGVTIVGPDALPVTLKGTSPVVSGLSSVLTIDTQANVNLKNLHITGGIAGDGGGIDDRGSQLTIDRCIIEGNSAGFGGGISKWGGSMTVNDSTVSNNVAGLFGRNGSFGTGGGIGVRGAIATLNGTTVDSNRASSFSFGGGTFARGGGIYSDSVLVVSGGRIENNVASSEASNFFSSASSGGGIYSDGLLSVEGAAFAGNVSVAIGIPNTRAFGGAVFQQRGPSNLANNTFTNNSAQARLQGASIFDPATNVAQGGAVAVSTSEGSYAFLAGNAFTGNRAEVPTGSVVGRSLDGGAVAVLGGPAISLERNTFTSGAVVGAVDPVSAVALVGDSLVLFGTSQPGWMLGSVPVTGLLAGDALKDIDFRPQNGLLYGLALNSATGAVRVYTVSVRTGAANPLGATGTFVDATGTPIADLGSDFGIDFNPTVDRLRVTSDLGLNFRIDPNTGAFADGNLGGAVAVAGLNPDGNLNVAGVIADISATAYTNNVPNSTVTSQYTIGDVADTLNIQSPPNSGNQIAQFAVTVGGVAVDVQNVEGFDIPDSAATKVANGASAGVGFAVLTIGGTTSLYSIDLGTGKATVVGGIGGAASVDGLAVQATATGSIRLSADGGSLVRGRLDGTGNSATVAILDAATGTVPVRLVGLDFRPKTGQLFGLAVDPALDAATLYRVDPQTGRATVVGTPGGIAFVDAAGARVDLPELSAGYEVDFNPAVDRLRVVTGSGLNFRINPDTGAPADGNLGGGAGTVAGTNTDAGLDPFAGGTAATAYTNNSAPVAGAPAITTQYTIAVSGGVGTLSIQNPPNLGVLASPLVLTLDGSTPLSVSAVLGFDIPATVVAPASGMPVASGSGFAILAVGGVTSTYSIDLTSGRAMPIAGTTGTGTDLTLATGSGLEISPPAKGAGLSVADGALVYLTGNTFSGSEVRAGDAVLRLSDLSGTARSKGGNAFGGFRSADGTLIAEAGADIIALL